jgi:hypothetical protein
MQRRVLALLEQHPLSDEAVPLCPEPPSGMESNSAERKAPPSTTPIDEESTRLVVLVIKSSKRVATVAGVAPLTIENASAWQPNKPAIEAKYPWLCRLIGIDALIKLALDIVAK